MKFPFGGIIAVLLAVVAIGECTFWPSRTEWPEDPTVIKLVREAVQKHDPKVDLEHLKVSHVVRKNYLLYSTYNANFIIGDKRAECYIEFYIYRKLDIIRKHNVHVTSYECHDTNQKPTDRPTTTAPSTTTPSTTTPSTTTPSATAPSTTTPSTTAPSTTTPSTTAPSTTTQSTIPPSTTTQSTTTQSKITPEK